MSISSTGVLNFHQPAIFNSSLTLGNNNLQTQLSTLAPKESPIFTGNITSGGIITGRSSNWNGGWNGCQVLAAPSGSTSAAYVRCLDRLEA